MKKKTDPTPPAAEPEVKRVRLDLDPETHRRLRVVAAEDNLPMSTFAIRLVAREVNRRYEARGAR